MAEHAPERDFVLYVIFAKVYSMTSFIQQFNNCSGTLECSTDSQLWKLHILQANNSRLCDTPL